MKRIIYSLLAVATLLVFACEKRNDNPGLEQRLIGEWEFVKAVGGFTGSQVILPPANTKTILIFNPDHQYKRNINDQTVEQGTYDLIRVTNISTREPYEAIRFNDKTQPGQLISITNDSLWITDNHVEPFGYLYIKSN